MAKCFPTTLCTVALACLVATAANAQDRTPADLAAENEVQLQLLQQQRQIRDMLGTDQILASLPTVISVMQFQGKSTARLALANGAVLTFAEGDEIMERMRLASVAPRAVQVSIEPLPNAKSKKPVRMKLAFKAAATTSPASGSPIMQPAMPMQGGMPPAPLAIPEGLLQMPPALPRPGTSAMTSSTAVTPATPVSNNP